MYRQLDFVLLSGHLHDMFYAALRVICHWKGLKRIQIQLPDEETESETEITFFMAIFKYGLSVRDTIIAITIFHLHLMKSESQVRNPSLLESSFTHYRSNVF